MLQFLVASTGATVAAGVMAGINGGSVQRRPILDVRVQEVIDLTCFWAQIGSGKIDC